MESEHRLIRREVVEGAVEIRCGVERIEIDCPSIFLGGELLFVFLEECLTEIASKQAVRWFKVCRLLQQAATLGDISIPHYRQSHAEERQPCSVRESNRFGESSLGGI